MAERPEIKRTLGDARLGHLRDMEDGDFSRGYFDAAPEGSYEGSLTDGVGTLHAGHTEPEDFRRRHGLYDEYGFVKRSPFERT
jgi:hypothetical protein